MKNIFTFIFFGLLATGLFAQAPEKVSYQAVVRNAGGTLVALKPVGMRISIIRTNEFGPSVYVETQTPTTNLNGLLSIVIGNGTPVLGTFTTIDWANGPYFMKTEMDPNGGTSYSISGTQQLMSVPYALYSDKAKTADRAKVADSMDANVKIDPSKLNAAGANTDDLLRWNGTSWQPTPQTPYVAGNGIEINNNRIGTAWSSNGYGPYTDSLLVGIGTRNPYSKLHVSGSNFNVISTNFEGSGWNSFYRYGQYLGYLGIYSDTSSLDFGTSGSGTNVNIVTGAQPRLTVSGSNVGIGTTTPTTRLDVNGKTKTTDLQITNGAGTGKILTSDASGNASWTAAGKQIMGVYPLNGSLGSGYNSMTGYAFMGPTQTITITSTGDVIVGSAQVPMAASALVAAQFGLGYQLQPSGIITNFTGGSYSYVNIGTERNSQAAAATVTNLAPGTYKVGLVINNTSATLISNNDYVNGYFMLIR